MLWADFVDSVSVEIPCSMPRECQTRHLNHKCRMDDTPTSLILFRVRREGLAASGLQSHTSVGELTPQAVSNTEYNRVTIHTCSRLLLRVYLRRVALSVSSITYR